MSGAIELTGVDFNLIKQNLINYLKSQPELTDYDFDGSNIQVILNLLAYQAQLNAYSTNMIANESFLTSASIRNNVIANARSLGYVPTSARAARVVIDFSIQLSRENYPQGFPQFVEIRPGSVFSAGTEGGSFMFNTIDMHTTAVTSEGTAVFRNVVAYEGVYLPMEFTVNKSDYTQKFILNNPNIDSTTLRVEVQEDPNITVNSFYRQANNLVLLSEESRAYWIEEENDGHYELTFGDGKFGKALVDGAKIYATYIVTNGPLGNGIQGANNFTFDGLVYDSFGNNVGQDANILSVETSNGGVDIEPVPSVKFRAPKNYGAQNRCVVAADYEALVREVYPSVKGVYAYGGETLPLPEYGRVYVVVKPLLGDKLSNIAKNFIKKSLEPYRVGSLDIVLEDPNVLYVEINTLIHYDESKTIKDSSTIVSDVSNVLMEYARSLNVSKFGGAVRYSNIVAAIDDVEPAITRNNSQLIMRKDGKALIDTLASYEICFENAIKLDCNNSVVYSSGFYLEVNNVRDDKTIYYFEDDPQSGKIGDLELTNYEDLSRKQQQDVKRLIPYNVSDRNLPAAVYVHKETKEVFLSPPLGKIRRIHFNANNQKVIDDPEFGTVDYERGEVKVGYQNPFKVINTVQNENPNVDFISIEGGIIQTRAVPRSQDVIAKHSVYLDLDISQSNITAKEDTKIGEI